MTIELNHTIVHATDPAASAAWFGEVFGLGAPERFGPFVQFTVDNGVSLDYYRASGPIRAQHYAFRVDEETFYAIFERLKARGIDYYADPGGHRRGEINRNDGGRGTYFADPDGHWMEILTVPYGGEK